MAQTWAKYITWSFCWIIISQKGTVCSFSNKYAYVGVTPLIIDGTLRENILYGNGKTIEGES